MKSLIQVSIIPGPLSFKPERRILSNDNRTVSFQVRRNVYVFSHAVNCFRHIRIRQYFKHSAYSLREVLVMLAIVIV